MALRKYSKFIVLESPSNKTSYRLYCLTYVRRMPHECSYFQDSKHQIFRLCLQLMRCCLRQTTPRLSSSTPETSTGKRGRLCGESGSEKSQDVMTTAIHQQFDLLDIARFGNWRTPRSMQRAVVFVWITDVSRNVARISRV